MPSLLFFSRILLSFTSSYLSLLISLKVNFSFSVLTSKSYFMWFFFLQDSLYSLIFWIAFWCSSCFLFLSASYFFSFSSALTKFWLFADVIIFFLCFSIFLLFITQLLRLLYAYFCSIQSFLLFMSSMLMPFLATFTFSIKSLFLTLEATCILLSIYNINYSISLSSALYLSIIFEVKA